MYYHFKKLQAANPCTEMTGFTRMLNSVGAKPDGLMDEIPTVLVNALDQGSGCRAGTENTCDMGFPVMNRPHGVTRYRGDIGEIQGRYHGRTGSRSLTLTLTLTRTRTRTLTITRTPTPTLTPTTRWPC